MRTLRTLRFAIASAPSNGGSRGRVGPQGAPKFATTQVDATAAWADLSDAAARQERIDRLRRNRAAAVPLRVAFPAVQHLRIELKFESSSTKAPTLQSHVLHPPAQAFFDFPCPYADCDGHFDLTGAINVALADPAHHGAGVLECSGLRLRDWASKRPCQLHLIYKVMATYRRDI